MRKSLGKAMEVSLGKKIIASIMMLSYIFVLSPVSLFAEEVKSNAEMYRGVSVKEEKSEVLISAKEGGTVTLGSASIEIPGGALKEDTAISITRLYSVEDTGESLYNAIPNSGGYRFLPAGTKFEKEVIITLPYNEELNTKPQSLDELYTYFYDTQKKCWIKLERLEVDKENYKVRSLSTHFTDMINATLTMPESASPVDVNLNSIKNLEAAKPDGHLIKFNPPKASNMGDASFSFELAIPAGRKGMQPQISISYSSAGGNGIMGKGFDVSYGSSITIDTRFGLPKYDGKEQSRSEEYIGNEKVIPTNYMLDGILLYEKNRDGKNVYYMPQKETSFSRIKHILSDNHWEVTDKSGTTRFYDQSSEACVGSGNETFTWNVTKIVDVNGNNIVYKYIKDEGYVYLDQICYTGNENTNTTGKYFVKFYYDNKENVNENPIQRQDIRIDARSKSVVACKKLLTCITTYYGSITNDNAIRKYSFSYKEGLAKEKQLITFTVSNNADESYVYTFDYIEPEKIGSNIKYFDDATVWENGQPVQTGNSTSIGANFNAGAGVGYGFEVVDVRVTGGADGAISEGNNYTEDTIVDINGDGKPDAVYQYGDEIKVFLSKKQGFGFNPTSQNLVLSRELTHELDNEKTKSSSFGWNVYSGAGSKADTIKVGVGYSEVYQKSTSTLNCSFMDIDGDGLVDIVESGKSTYLKNKGNLEFEERTLYSDGDVNVTDITQTISEEEKEQYRKTYFVQNPFRMWKAPLEGIATITERAYGIINDENINKDTPFKSVVATTLTENETEMYPEFGITIENDKSIELSKSNYELTKGKKLFFISDSGVDPRNSDINWNIEIEYTKAKALKQGWPLPIFVPEKLPKHYSDSTKDTSTQSLEEYTKKVVEKFKQNFTNKELISAYKTEPIYIPATENSSAEYIVTISFNPDWTNSTQLYKALRKGGYYIPRAFTEEEFSEYVRQLNENNSAAKYIANTNNTEADFYKNFASKFEYSITDRMFFLKNLSAVDTEGSCERKTFFDTYPMSNELKEQCLEKFNIKGINNFFTENNIKYYNTDSIQIPVDRKRNPENPGTIFEKNKKALYNIGFFSKDGENYPVYFNETDGTIECNDSTFEELKVETFNKGSDSASIKILYNEDKENNNIYESTIVFNLNSISYQPLNITNEEFKKIYDDIDIPHMDIHDSYWVLEDGSFIKEEDLKIKFQEMDFTEEEQEKLITALYGPKKEKTKLIDVPDYYYYTMLEKPDYSSIIKIFEKPEEIEKFKLEENENIKEEELIKLFAEYELSEENQEKIILALYGEKKVKTKQIEVLDYYYYTMLDDPDYTTAQINLNSFDVDSYKVRIVNEKKFPFYEKTDSDYVLKEFWKTKKNKNQINSIYREEVEKEVEEEVKRENPDKHEYELNSLIQIRVTSMLDSIYREYENLYQVWINTSKKFNLGKISGISCDITYEREHLYELNLSDDNSAEYSILGVNNDKGDIILLFTKNTIPNAIWNSFTDFNSNNINKEYEIYNYSQGINVSDFLSEKEIQSLESSEVSIASQITVTTDEFLYGGTNSWYYGIWKGSYSDVAFSKENLNSYKLDLPTEIEDSKALLAEQKQKSEDKKEEIKKLENQNQTVNDESVSQEEDKTHFYLPLPLAVAINDESGINKGLVRVVNDENKFLCGTISTYSEILHGRTINSYYMPFIDGDMIHADRAGGISYYKIEGLDLYENNNTSQSQTDFIGTKEFYMPSIRKTITDGTDRTPKVDVSVTKVFQDLDDDLWEKLKDVGSGSGSRGWNKSESNVKQSLQDINGDGIPDILQITDNGINITNGEIINETVVFKPLFSSFDASTFSKNKTDVNVFGGSVSPGGNVSIRLKGTKQAFPVQEPKPSATAGFTTTNGSNSQSAGLVDLNGDGLPDYYDGQTLCLNNGSSFVTSSLSSWNNFGSMTESSNLSVGANFSVGKSYGGEDVNSLKSGVGLSIGGSYSASTSNIEKMLLDINGDGLQDIIEMNVGSTTISVLYNTGNSFVDGESIELQSWEHKNIVDLLTFGNGTDNTGFSLGVVDDIPLIGSVTKTVITRTAINPYGLKANKYANALEWNTSLTLGISGSLGANVNVPLKVFVPMPFPVWVGSFDITANEGAGVNLSTSINGVSVRMMDLDGDGLADHVLRIPGTTFNNGVTYWKRNVSGKYGLLRQVNLPQGGNIQIEYKGIYGNPENPNFKYVMSSVTMNDGAEGNSVLPVVEHGKHSVTTVYEYEDAKYDRDKKEFWGFETVKTIDAIGAYTIDTYFQGDYYLKGCVRKSLSYTHDNILIAKNKTDYSNAPYSLPKLEENWTLEISEGIYSENAISEQNSIYTSTKYYYDYDGPDYVKYNDNNQIYGNCVKIQQDFGDSESLTGEIRYKNIDSETKYITGLPLSILVYSKEESQFPIRYREGDYDDLGRLEKLKQYWAYEEGNCTTNEITYDDYGNILSIKDGRGAKLDYTYEDDVYMFVKTIDQSGKITESGTYVSEFKYDPKSQTKIFEKDCSGNSIKYKYDDWQRIIEIRTDYDSKDETKTPAVSYEYYTPGIEPNGHHELWYAITNNKVIFDENDTSAIQTVVQIDGVGRVVRTAKTGFVNNKDGWNVSGVVKYDEKGRTIEEGMTEFVEGTLNDLFNYPFQMTESKTLYTYDDKDRQIITVLPDMAKQTNSFIIENNLLISRTTDPKGNVSIQKTDSRGNIVCVEQEDEEGLLLTKVTYQYNTIGEMLKAVTVPLKNTDGIKEHPILIEYDMLGRRTAIESSDSGRQEYFYDECSNLIFENNSVLRENNKHIAYTYDDLNRLVKIKYPDTEPTIYTYGGKDAPNKATGKILKIQDASGTLEYEYGSLGEVIRETRTLVTHLNGLHDTITSEMKYRSDYLGRMQWIEYPDGEVITYGYDSGGQVISVTGKHWEETFEYVTNIQYDQYGQRTRIEYGNGTVTNYQYDQKRRWLDTINTYKTNGDSEKTPLKIYQNIKYYFDPVGNVEKYENKCMDGIRGNYETTQEYTYDNLYQLKSVIGNSSYTPDHSIVYESSYSQFFTFDDYGLSNMMTKTSQENVTPWQRIGDDLNYELDYEYDYENYSHRRIRAGNRYYKYDSNGNIICEQDGSFESNGDDTTYHKINRESDDVYSTDYGWGLFRDDSDDVNMQHSRYKRTYSWNEKNQLILSIDANYTTSYIYSQDGERTNKYTSSSETLYFNKMWSLHTDAGNSIHGGQFAKNVYLGDTRIVTKLCLRNDPRADAEELQQYFYHPDHLGSASLITDYKGDEYQRIEYTPYGETWIERTDNQGLEYLPYKFTAKELDPETGLYYYGARYLDSKYSTWISTDPALSDYIPQAPVSDEARKNNQNLPGMGGIFNHINSNLYAYAANNPVRYMDPDGNFDIEAFSNFLYKTADKMNSLYIKVTSWNYEYRDSANNINEFQNDIDAYNLLSRTKNGDVINGWRYEPRDACHQNGDEYHDEKYCNIDGREIVFDGKSIAEGNPTIDRNSSTSGTYNICDPGEKPSVINGKDNFSGWCEYIGRGIGHGIVDLLPWYILGSSRAEDVSFESTVERIKESVQ